MHLISLWNNETGRKNWLRTGTTAMLFSALLAVTLTALSGCGNNDTNTADQTPTTIVIAPSPTATPAATPTPPGSDTNAGPGGATGTNAALAEEINTKIVRNTQMTGSRVTAIVDDAGVATLNGFVQNQQQKALAAKAAQNTSGVVSVKNKLEIRPTGGTGKTPKPAPPTTNIIVVPGGTGTAPAAPPAPAASPAPGEGTTTPAATPTPDPNATPLGGYTVPAKPE